MLPLNKYKEAKGIPQGLSISNILAAIYVLEDIDLHIRNNYNCMFLRYVDDIFILSTKQELEKIKEYLHNKLIELNLSINVDKTGTYGCKEKFDYLGYSFKLPHVTVKQSSVDKFINSIAAKFSHYTHNKENKLNQFKYLNEYRLKEIFILELNEKITGAISENKRYGWIFYFNAINDQSILYKVDRIISRFFLRLDDFQNKAPSTLKKLSKAYFYGKYKRNSNYIHNYNQYQTEPEKLLFLTQRGVLDPEKGYSEKEINRQYNRIKNRNLSLLEKDDANMY